MDDRTEERMAANEATFREANERIEERARELEFEQPVPFLCECGEPSCQAIVRLSLDQYEAVRSSGVRFFILPEHEATAAAAGSIVERHETYLVVEKTGRAGEVAERRDPRQPSARR